MISCGERVSSASRVLSGRWASVTISVNDASGELAREWDVKVTPTLVVIYRGEVKSVTTGWTSSWGMRLRLWLASW